MKKNMIYISLIRLLRYNFTKIYIFLFTVSMLLIKGIELVIMILVVDNSTADLPVYFVSILMNLSRCMLTALYLINMVFGVMFSKQIGKENGFFYQLGYNQTQIFLINIFYFIGILLVSNIIYIVCNIIFFRFSSIKIYFSKFNLLYLLFIFGFEIIIIASDLNKLKSNIN